MAGTLEMLNRELLYLFLVTLPSLGTKRKSLPPRGHHQTGHSSLLSFTTTSLLAVLFSVTLVK